MKLLNIFTNILILSSMALSVACNETEERGSEARTINAVIVQPDTRTSLNGPDANGIYKTVWSSGDQIMVFSGDYVACRYILKSGENTNKGVFEGYGDSEDLVAVYPLSIGHSRTGATIEVGLPEIQEYVSGNIPLGAYPMLGIYGDETFSFRNLCSVLKVPMLGNATVKSITFTPNNAGVKASGKAIINANSKTLEMAGNAKSSVMLDCHDVKLSAQPTDFHFVVPAQKYPDGFTLTITTDQGDVVKTLKSDITLDRSVLYPIEAFECKIDDSKDNIVFEDANFKVYMVANFDKNNDGEISYNEALDITKISVNTDNISSLVGIERMTNLVSLKCRGENSGRLSKLDLSENKNLKTLFCDGNQLSTLDVSGNVKLDSLVCSYNNITDLNVSSNTSLSFLECSFNKLSRIDLSNNHNLQYFQVEFNNLRSIDVSNCPKLKLFNCAQNEISSTLDVSMCKELTIFQCWQNNIPSITMSTSTELYNFYCGENELESLDISANTGLKDFSCHKNKLKTLDVSHNTLIWALDCSSNNLEALDISSNTKLQSLICNDNKLKSLDTQQNQELYSLDCFDNEIESLDISNNNKLAWLYCQNNPLKLLYTYKDQVDAIKYKNIPSTARIIVKGSEEPEEWAGKEFWHKSLGMRFTATWCGYCPNLATSFAKAVSQYPNRIELLNLHPTSSNLGFSETYKLENIFKITGYPTGIVDYRKEIKNYSSNDYTAKLIVDAVKETENNYPTKTGISFTSSVSGSKLNLNVKLYIKEKGDYKVTAVLLEDNIIGYQNGGGDNYNHSSIARVAFTDITGDAFSTTSDNKTVEKSYSVAIPSSYNKENLRILVYVLKQYGSQPIIRTANYGDYYVDNATSAPIGTTKDLIFIDGTTYGGNEDTKDGGEITLK